MKKRPGLHKYLVSTHLKALTILSQVDFQYCVWASPAIDLLSVLYLVATSDVRQRFKNELITYYYNEFTKTLKSIGHLAKPPSMLDLQIELQSNGFLGIEINENERTFSHTNYCLVSTLQR